MWCEMCTIVGDKTPACAYCPECGASKKCELCYLKDAECIYRCHNVGYILHDGNLIHSAHIHHPISPLRNLLVPLTVTRPLGVFLSLPIHSKSSLPPVEMMLLDFAHVPSEVEWGILRQRLYRRIDSALLCYYGTCVAHWSDVRLFLAKTGSTRLYQLASCTIDNAIVRKCVDSKYGCDYIHIVCVTFDPPVSLMPSRIKHTKHGLFLVYIRMPHLDLFGFAPVSKAGMHIPFELPECTIDIKPDVKGVWKDVIRAICDMLHKVGLSSTYKMLAYNTTGARTCVTNEIMCSLAQTKPLISNHIMMVDVVDVYDGYRNKRPCVILTPRSQGDSAYPAVYVQRLHVDHE